MHIYVYTIRILKIFVDTADFDREEESSSAESHSQMLIESPPPKVLRSRSSIRKPHISSSRHSVDVPLSSDESARIELKPKVKLKKRSSSQPRVRKSSSVDQLCDTDKLTGWDELSMLREHIRSERDSLSRARRFLDRQKHSFTSRQKQLLSARQQIEGQEKTVGEYGQFYNKLNQVCQFY